ncbi:MAG: helix-turn-helix domain-containing protein [Armatimonadetes bacterium]|nr:helix-turn-helix domain-containing protein [Armatimonadota bacterium]
MVTSNSVGTHPRAESRVASALFGSTQRAVLGLLFCHSDEAFYLSEIIRAAGTGAGAVQRELDRLLDAGLVTRSRRGNLVFYQANREAPVFPALRELMVKTAGVADVLRAALAPLSARIRVAFVYGSMARGEERSGSDVDVMVIGEVSFGEVVNALHPSQETLGREVNPNVYSPGEWREKATAGHSFITMVLGEPKVFLIGCADGLGRLAAERVASVA